MDQSVATGNIEFFCLIVVSRCFRITHNILNYYGGLDDESPIQIGRILYHNSALLVVQSYCVS